MTRKKKEELRIKKQDELRRKAEKDTLKKQKHKKKKLKNKKKKEDIQERKKHILALINSSYCSKDVLRGYVDDWIYRPKKIRHMSGICLDWSHNTLKSCVVAKTDYGASHVCRTILDGFCLGCFRKTQVWGTDAENGDENPLCQYCDEMTRMYVRCDECGFDSFYYDNFMCKYFTPSEVMEKFHIGSHGLRFKSYACKCMNYRTQTEYDVSCKFEWMREINTKIQQINYQLSREPLTTSICNTLKKMNEIRVLETKSVLINNDISYYERVDKDGKTIPNLIVVERWRDGKKKELVINGTTIKVNNEYTTLRDVKKWFRRVFFVSKKRKHQHTSSQDSDEDCYFYDKNEIFIEFECDTCHRNYKYHQYEVEEKTSHCGGGENLTVCPLCEKYTPKCNFIEGEFDEMCKCGRNCDGVDKTITICLLLHNYPICLKKQFPKNPFISKMNDEQFLANISLLIPHKYTSIYK